MKKLICLFSLIGLVSCGDSGNDSSAKKKQESVKKPVKSTATLIVRKKVKLNKDFSNLDEFKKNINTYAIAVEAKAGHFVGAQFECGKTNFDRNHSKESAAFDSHGLSARLDLKILDTDPAVVKYNCVIRDGAEILETLPLELTKSYVISGSRSFRAAINTEEIHTLFLDKGAELSTDGMSWYPKISELISNGGKIVTFKEKDVIGTRPNRDGLPGNIIYVEVETGLGDITFELKGTNGGEQTVIPEKNSKIPPRDPKLDGKCDIPADAGPTVCPGKNGQKGYTGAKGLQGYDGGDSGSLFLKVMKKHNLKIDVRYFPGKGSKGGKGGPGGVGGPGGRGYVSSPRTIPDSKGCVKCSNLKSVEANKSPHGSRGSDGDTGPDGSNGWDGINGTSLIEFLYSDRVFQFASDWKSDEV